MDFRQQLSRAGHAGIRAFTVIALLAVVAVPSKAMSGQNPGPGAGPQPDWAKVCAPVQQDIECHTSRKRLGATGQPLAQLLVIERGNQKLIQIAVPPVALIQPGVQVKIDTSEAVAVNYVVCTPRECLALGEIDTKFIDRLKRGRALTIVALNPQGKPLSFEISLTGFTKVYEGKGIDLAEAQAREQGLIDALQRRRDEARQKLLEAQQQASAQ